MSEPHQPAIIDYDAIAGAYAVHRQVHPGVFRGLVEEGKVTARSRVLEVGCGSGNYSIAMADQTGCTAEGIDPAPAMLEQARSRPSAVRFRAGAADNLGVGDSSHDLIFSVDVIHNVADIDAYMANAYRALAAGGRLCTVTDSAWVITHRVPLTSYFPETAAVDLRRYPGVERLRQAMLGTGFTVVFDTTVEHPYLLSDAAPYRQKVFSSLHLIDSDAYARGLASMEADLRAGPISCVARYTLVWGEK